MGLSRGVDGQTVLGLSGGRLIWNLLFGLGWLEPLSGIVTVGTAALVSVGSVWRVQPVRTEFIRGERPESQQVCLFRALRRHAIGAVLTESPCPRGGTLVARFLGALEPALVTVGHWLRRTFLCRHRMLGL